MPGLLRNHADRRPFLLGRMRIMTALRDYFATRDFVEVETSILARSPGNETHLHAFATDLVSPAGTRERYYLRTSPEFASKKLLAAGERRIVEFARVLRNRESGALDASPAPTKWAMARLGLCGDAVRLPIIPLTPAGQAAVGQSLREAGLL